jgi:hypothetical protein
MSLYGGKPVIREGVLTSRHGLDSKSSRQVMVELPTVTNRVRRWRKNSSNFNSPERPGIDMRAYYFLINYNVRSAYFRTITLMARRTQVIPFVMHEEYEARYGKKSQDNKYFRVEKDC